MNLFKKHNVKYLIVGGYAVMRYTEPRFTKDLDLLISVEIKNATAVFNALKEFGAPLSGLTVADFRKEGYFYQMGRSPMRVDILMSIPGVIFNDAWSRHERLTIDGIEMNFISKEDLISSKRASGRPQDLIDIENLEKAL
ncbi:MAG: nucleotidyl transferase AbiEii/AbiGii toxin family protein [Deltaproteobacteria bacterium]|nr:nucleotidyl transferase AbiEii/AbiGii toxin family protein [Deltaproteobacteria bacterium]